MAQSNPKTILGKMYGLAPLTSPPKCKLYTIITIQALYCCLLQLFSNEGYGRSSDKGLTDDEIEWCLYSMGDNSSFLLFNRDPVDRMISYLKKYFGSGASRYLI